LGLQVGIPLVKNSLVGYKTSILSYGQVLYRILLNMSLGAK